MLLTATLLPFLFFSLSAAVPFLPFLASLGEHGHGGTCSTFITLCAEPVVEQRSAVPCSAPEERRATPELLEGMSLGGLLTFSKPLPVGLDIREPELEADMSAHFPSRKFEFIPPSAHACFQFHAWSYHGSRTRHPYRTSVRTQLTVLASELGA